MPDHSPWWMPDVHADRRPFLLARNRIQQAFRGYFIEQDFIEVDPAILCVSPGNEAHLHGFATQALSIDGTTQSLYLHTSPEFAAKKLLAAGEKRISCFAHVFRNRERGPLHHPEFTMLEWYRVAETYDVLMEDCAALVELAARATGTSVLRHKDKTCDPFLPFERVSVHDAFLHYADIDLLSSVHSDGTTDRDRLAYMMEKKGFRVGPEDTWADLASRIMVGQVEPHLGMKRMTVLDEYPVSEAALARPSAHDPRVAERFELYACGVELANAFGELTDAQEQRKRFEAEMAEKQRVYGERYPVDQDFLLALERMPDASGIALGFDRLVMLATGADKIEQVLWSPVPEVRL